MSVTKTEIPESMEQLLGGMLDSYYGTTEL